MALHKEHKDSVQQQQQAVNTTADQNRQQTVNNEAEALKESFNANAFSQQQQFNANQFQEALNVNNTNASGLEALGTYFFNALGGQGVNERITALAEAGREYYEQGRRSNTGSNLKVDFIVAPGNRISDYYGGLIVAIQWSQPGTSDIEVGAHLIIVEGSSSLKPQVINDNGNTITIPNTAGNVVSPATVKGVENLVREHYGNSNLNVINAGFSVLPVEADIKNVMYVNQVLQYAANASLVRIQMYHAETLPSEGELLANVIGNKQNGVTVAAQIEDNPTNQVDVFGMPVRADFHIRSVATQTGTQTNHAEQGMLELGSVNAFCTPVYLQPAQQYGFYPQMQQQQYYVNQVVVKDIKPGTTRLSLGNALLLLATTGLLATNNLWRRAYIPNTHIPAGNMDIKDIGALGYEVPTQPAKPGEVPPTPTRFNTKSSEFDHIKFNQMMDMLFRPELMYAIDVPDGHYLLGVFLAEANGDANCHRLITETLDKMTKGSFTMLFNDQQPYFINRDTRIINGYYRNGNQNMSLDVLDHLAMLNLASGDSVMMRQYESSYHLGSPVMRIAKRLDLIEAMSDGQPVVKGYSNRIYMNPKFLEAMMAAFKSKGVFPEIQGANLNNMQAYARPTFDQFSNLMVNPGHIPVMTTGYGNTPAYQNLQYGYNGFPVM